MDRRGFQVNIGTIMLAVAAVAVAVAVLGRGYAAFATFPLVYLPKLVVYAHIRSRCRAEGRDWSDTDSKAVGRGTFWVINGILIILAIAAAVKFWLL